MAKKKHVGGKEAPANRFEAILNRKKFAILGRKVKGSVEKRGVARSAGTEKRKNTLLVEMQQSQRANSFIDRRIGENDEGLTADDRAIARFQKQRMKEISRGKGFNVLGDEDTEQLTHLDFEDDLDLGRGSALGAPRNSSDDDDEELFTRAQFGGGERVEEGQIKSKKEVMDEIIAKSKQRKAEKAKQRDADTDATEALDRDLAQLMQSGALQKFIAGKGVKIPKTAALDDAERAYDLDRRDLVYQAKGKVGDRLKTEEEIMEEQARLVKAQETSQRKRMLEEDGPEQPASEQLPAGGYALRRAKRQQLQRPQEATGDALEDDFEPGSDTEASSGGDDTGAAGSKLSLDERRVQRAAGDHPLQELFRETAGQLMEKYGLQEREANGEDSGGKGDSGSEGGTVTDEEEDAAGAESPSEESQDRNHTPAEDSQPEEQPATSGAQQKEDVGRQAAARSLPAPQAPQTYKEYLELVSDLPQGSWTSRLTELQSNAERACAGDRQKIQILFGCFVQHFADTAGKEPVPTEELDALTSQILGLTPRVPLYAATTALARLGRLQERLTATLAAETTDRQQGWPTQRQMLLLKLWATIFPASDRRHPVLTPAILMTASFLALCPVKSLGDVKAGLFLSCLGLHMAAAANRWMPEPLTFAMRVLVTALRKTCPQRLSGWLWPFNLSESESSAQATDSRLPADLQLSIDCSWESALAAAFGVLQRSAELQADAASLPEMVAPALQLLHLLEKQSLSKPLEMRRQQALLSIQKQVERSESQRTPLRKARSKPEVKLFNPRFEEDYTAGVDYDPDRERAEGRKLKRMLTKERRGAMRELRKDAAFLGQESGKQKEAQRSELKRTLQKNTTWLQKLESDFKSGGQGGMWKKSKRRK